MNNMEQLSSQTTEVESAQGSEVAVMSSCTPREEPISWTTPLSLGLYTLVPSQANRNPLSPSQVFLAQTVQVGLISGLLLGALRGGQNRGAAFLAENAHRLPKTNLGFYNFQKQRNNQMVRAAAESGARYGLRFGALLGVYGLGEYCTEVFVTKKESWLGPLVGGLLCGGSVIATYRMDWYTSKRILALSAGLGLLNGILQDTYAYFYGVSVKDQKRERPRSETFDLMPVSRLHEEPSVA